MARLADMGQRAISVVGGGLAGLTLGIALRLRGVPVTVWERGPYPRHRVCGEVLSGRGCAVLKGLGLTGRLLDSGAQIARSTAFYAGRSQTRAFTMTAPAQCLDRYTLDHLLANRFRELGGELRDQQRWPQETFPSGVVRSTGRPLEAVESGWRWIGLKGHACDVHLDADVEMHLQPFGYVGLCRLSRSRVNVCGLFRIRRNARSSATPAPAWLKGLPGSRLHERLAAARWDESAFCAVAGLGLRPRRASAAPECRVGDALTMIPPVTGNGMSMAIESAEIAVPYLEAFSRSALEWSDAQASIAACCDLRFGRRLRAAQWLHALLFSPVGRAGLSAGTRCPGLWELMFALTR